MPDIQVSRNNSEIVIFNSIAIRSMFRKLRFRSPRSTAPTYDLSRSHARAKPSCEYPADFLNVRKRFPKRFRMSSFGCAIQSF